MTHEQHFDAGVPAEAQGGISRRKMIVTGAALAVAGGAVGAAGAVAVSKFTETSGSVAKPEGEVMLYLKNHQSGELDLFVNERRSTIVNRSIADALAQVANEANAAAEAE